MTSTTFGKKKSLPTPKKSIKRELFIDFIIHFPFSFVSLIFFLLMSVATLNVHNHNIITIGASHSYCFYQELSVRSSTLRPTTQIIPSIPRQHL